VDGQSNGKFITVAGKKYTIALRLHCYDGSTWELTKDKYGNTRDGISSGVWQSYKAFDRMPPSYEKKAVAEIIAQVSDYLKGHPFQRAQAPTPTPTTSWRAPRKSWPSWRLRSPSRHASSVKPSSSSSRRNWP
jgi:hypothetical protein